MVGEGRTSGKGPPFYSGAQGAIRLLLHVGVQRCCDTLMDALQMMRAWLERQ
jgi:hypothetical protein